jgi:hypothetical protein
MAYDHMEACRAARAKLATLRAKYASSPEAGLVFDVAVELIARADDSRGELGWGDDSTAYARAAESLDAALAAQTRRIVGELAGRGAKGL